MAAATTLLIGRIKDVRRAITFALRDAPESNDLLYILAALEGNAGDRNKSLHYLRIILNRDSDDRDARMALRLLPYGIIPISRIPDDNSILQLLFQPRTSSSSATLFHRLAHGICISAGGALSYHDVCKICNEIWLFLSPLQKKLCDRMPLWPQAIYHYIFNRLGIAEPCDHACLWSNRVSQHQVRRKVRYLESICQKMG